MRIPIAVTFALLLAGLLAPAANAAWVSVESSDGTIYVNVAGGPEADVLTVSSPSQGRFVVTQAPGVPLYAYGSACTLVAAGRVDCTAPAAGALVVGGAGNDRLAISGTVGLGAWLFGSDGDDVLTGGPGADRLDGGAGADVLHAVDGRQDALVCGTGADSYDADGADTITADCEQRVEVPAPADPTPPTTPDPGPLPAPPLPAPLPPAPAPVEVGTASATLSHGAVPLRVACSAAARCHGWITVRLLQRARAGKSAAGGPVATAAGSRRPVISRRRYSVGAGRTKTIKAQISRRGRQRVLQRRRARCSVKISSVAPDGSVQVSTKRITIKAGGSR